MVTKIIKCLCKWTFKASVVFLLIALIPNLPPYSKFSEPYSVTPSLPFEGKLALNEKLNDAEIIFKGKLHGPEAFAIYNGELYTTLHGGNVVKIVGNDVIPVVKFGKPCKGVYQEQICGRPLGLTFDKNGALYVADAYYGIFKVDVKTGKYEQLVSMDEEIDNKKPKLPNSVAVASNGDVYWTDSSTDFALYDGLFDVFSDGSGRVIHYDARTKKNRVLLGNVHFANGILLSKDESFIIVAECARSRLLRYYIKGPKKGTSDIFVDGLPGMPDNLQSDGQGGFFTMLAVSKDNNNPSLLQIFGPFPLIRKFIARVQGLVELTFKLVDQVYPNEWAERAVHFIGSFPSFWYIVPIEKRLTILHISETGSIIDSLHALNGKLNAISDAIIYNDALYLGSPHNDFLAKASLDKTGLRHLAVVKHAESTTTKTPTVPSSTTSKHTATKAPAPEPSTTPKPTTVKPDTKLPQSQSTTQPPPSTTPPPTSTTKSPPSKPTTPSPLKPTTPPPPKPTTPPPPKPTTPPPPKPTTPPPPKPTTPPPPKPTTPPPPKPTTPPPPKPTTQPPSKPTTQPPSKPTTLPPPSKTPSPPPKAATPPVTIETSKVKVEEEMKAEPPSPAHPNTAPTVKSTPAAKESPATKVPVDTNVPKEKPISPTASTNKPTIENVKSETKESEPKINKESKEKK